MTKRTKKSHIYVTTTNFIRIAVLLLGIVIIIYLFFSIIQKNEINHQRENRHVYIGLWTQGFLNNQTNTIDPQKLISLQNEIGKKVAIAQYYEGWEYLSNDQIIKDTNIIFNNGWRPMISANPYFFSECPAHGMTLYKAIANGNCDAFLHKIGKTLKKINKPFFLRFAWEMNVNTMQWSINYIGSSPQDFINAWKRFHNILAEEGAKNVIWVFSPQVESSTTTNIATLYPGDKYVDWVALDGYNWGTSQSWSTWQTFYSIFYASYNKFEQIAPNKPLMIAEVNTTNVGGNQADWYNAMLSMYIPNDFPKIKAIVFFNEDKTATEGVKWLIDNTPESLAQFKNSINDPMYTSNF